MGVHCQTNCTYGNSVYCIFNQIASYTYNCKEENSTRQVQVQQIEQCKIHNFKSTHNSSWQLR